MIRTKDEIEVARRLGIGVAPCRNCHEYDVLEEQTRLTYSALGKDLETMHLCRVCARLDRDAFNERAWECAIRDSVGKLKEEYAKQEGFSQFKVEQAARCILRCGGKIYQTEKTLRIIDRKGQRTIIRHKHGLRLPRRF